MNLTITTNPASTAEESYQAWEVLGSAAALARRIGTDVIVQTEVAPAQVRMLLDDEADVWRVGPGLALFGRALWLEPGTGDLYRVAFGTYTFGGFRVELRSLADPDEDSPALSSDTTPGNLQIL